MTVRTNLCKSYIYQITFKLKNETPQKMYPLSCSLRYWWHSIKWIPEVRSLSGHFIQLYSYDLLYYNCNSILSALFQAPGLKIQLSPEATVLCLQSIINLQSMSQSTHNTLGHPIVTHFQISFESAGASGIIDASSTTKMCISMFIWSQYKLHTPPLFCFLGK